MDTPTIPPEVAAHVLWQFDRGGYQPGTFTQHLLSALGAADEDNFCRLADAFPEYAAAVAAIKYDPDGVAILQKAAKVGLRCVRCGDTDGPFAERAGQHWCEPCADTQPLGGGR